PARHERGSLHLLPPRSDRGVGAPLADHTADPPRDASGRRLPHRADESGDGSDHPPPLPPPRPKPPPVRRPLHARNLARRTRPRRAPHSVQRRPRALPRPRPDAPARKPHPRRPPPPRRTPPQPSARPERAPGTLRPFLAHPPRFAAPRGTRAGRAGSSRQTLIERLSAWPVRRNSPSSPARRAASATNSPRSPRRTATICSSPPT